MSREYVSQISQFPVFEGLKARDAQILIEHGSVHDLAAGEILFLEGAPADAVFVLLEGELEVFVARNKGNLVLATQPPGSIVGELAVLCGANRAASVRALYPSTVLRWEADEFRWVLISNKFLSERIFRQALSGLVEKEKSLLETLTRW